jgi:hypothetical protein
VVTIRTLTAGFVAAIVVVGLGVLGALDSTELSALSHLFEIRGPRTPSVPIVIVSIDEDSFDELDLPWPFPRALHATLIDRISAARPLAIGVDVLFPEPSPRGAADDAALGAAVARAGNVVLAAAITTVSESFYVKTDLNAPVPSIRKGAVAVAPVSYTTDVDGNIRRSMLRHRLGNETLAGWDVAIYRLAAARRRDHGCDQRHHHLDRGTGCAENEGRDQKQERRRSQRSAERGEHGAKKRAQDETLVLHEIDERHEQKQPQRITEQRQGADHARLPLGHGQRAADQADQDLRREQVGDDHAGRDGAEPDHGTRRDGPAR